MSGRTQPHDRNAERVVIGASLHSWRWHDATRPILEPGDFWFPQHATIYAACDQLAGIGPYPYGTWEEWADLWPQTPPATLNVRVAAVWTITSIGYNDVPLWALHRMADCDDGRHVEAAHKVKQRKAERDELVALAERFHQLSTAT